jgi:hypothetical protein
MGIELNGNQYSMTLLAHPMLMMSMHSISNNFGSLLNSHSKVLAPNGISNQMDQFYRLLDICQNASKQNYPHSS